MTQQVGFAGSVADGSVDASLRDGRGEEDVDPSTRRKRLGQRLKAADFVLEPLSTVVGDIEDYVRSYEAEGEGDVEGSAGAGGAAAGRAEAVELLGSGFRGYVDLVNTLSGWIEMADKAIAQAPETPSPAPERKLQSLGSVLLSRLQSMILSRYTSERGRMLLQRDEIPAFIEKMMLDPTWRKVIVKLAERHRGGDALMDYCVEWMAEKGLHADLAGLNVISRLVQLYKKVLADHLITAGAARNGDKFIAATADVVKTTVDSESTYMFTRSVLTKLESSVPELPPKKVDGSDAPNGSGAGAAGGAGADASEEGGLPKTRKRRRPLRAYKFSRLVQEADNSTWKPASEVRFRARERQVARDWKGIDNTVSKALTALLRHGQYVRCVVLAAPSVGGAGDVRAESATDKDDVLNMLGSGAGDVKIKRAQQAHLSQLNDAFRDMRSANRLPPEHLRHPDLLMALTCELFFPSNMGLSGLAKRCCVQLLAHAVTYPSSDEEPKSDAEREAYVAATEKLQNALTEAASACRNVLSITARTAFQVLETGRQFPAVACGIVFCARAVLATPGLYNNPAFANKAPFVLGFVRSMAEAWPLLRDDCFAALRAAFKLRASSMKAVQADEFRRSVLDGVLRLMQQGYGTAGLQLVRSGGVRLDKAELRHFAEMLVEGARGPYSRTFVGAFLLFLADEATRKALKIQRADNEKLRARLAKLLKVVSGLKKKSKEESRAERILERELAAAKPGARK